MQIKFLKLHESAQLPTYANPGDAGMDLRTIVSKVLKPGERFIFPTGLAVALPKGYVGLVWDRSGLAAKEGFTCLAGVIDAGYRGEIGIVALNTSKKAIAIEKGDRVAQLLVQPIIEAKIKEAKTLTNTQRGKGGFGASGKC
jgi:dUTP pyrophosphatase